MIVVAIIGILAAVAIPSFMDYIKRSKKTEAALQLNKLGKNAKRIYSENSSYYVGTVGSTPKPVGKGCCDGGAPNNHCAVDRDTFKAAEWKALDFQIDEPTLFYYDYDGEATSFVAHATGNLDCDDTEITYTLDGAAVGGNPTVVLTSRRRTRTSPPICSDRTGLDDRRGRCVFRSCDVEPHVDAAGAIRGLRFEEAACGTLRACVIAKQASR